MKKFICIPTIIINLIFIFGAIIVERYVYPGIYRTVFFWGISLYALAASCIILISEHKFPIMSWLSVAITAVIIIMFFMYMPKFTQEEALNIVSEDINYRQYTMIVDPVKPVENVKLSGVVRGKYRFVAQDNPTISVSFNPVSGKYKLSYFEDADIIPPLKSYSSLDISFEEEYNLIAAGDTYKKVSLVSKYKNLWTEELSKNYNSLYNLLNDENKALLNESLKKWQDSLLENESLVTAMLSRRFADSLNIDLYQLENSMYAIREKALDLSRLYEKIN